MLLRVQRVLIVFALSKKIIYREPLYELGMPYPGLVVSRVS